MSFAKGSNEGWDLVASRLSKFKKNNNDVDSFALAAHGIADFYAHSSYMHFADPIYDDSLNGHAECFSMSMLNQSGQLDGKIDYGKDSFDLSGDNFSVNNKYWDETDKNKVSKLWKNKIISGRYAQKGDSQGDILHKLIEARNNIPESMQDKKDFFKRGSLPHHNEIAVDEIDMNEDHKLYGKNDNKRLDYETQFNWRQNTAIKHIREAFIENWRKNVI